MPTDYWIQANPWYMETWFDFLRSQNKWDERLPEVKDFRARIGGR
jgi:hypothetical protein